MKVNQPPDSQPPDSQPPDSQPPDSQPTAPRAPQWRRPRGVAAGTWDYVNERSIADHYDAFVADTPLCRVDMQIVQNVLPGVASGRPETVLDLGCGGGRASVPLAERHYAVVAVDLSQPMLQRLANKAAVSSVICHVFPLRANLVQLDCFADRSADHAICLFSTLGMIQGRENRREMLRHVARIVRPGGKFLVHVHNRWAALREYHGVRSLAQSWWRSRRDARCEFGDATYAYRGLENMFLHRFSRRELARDLGDCGWNVEAIWPISIDGARIVPKATIPGGFVFLCRLPAGQSPVTGRLRPS